VDGTEKRRWLPHQEVPHREETEERRLGKGKHSGLMLVVITESLVNVMAKFSNVMACTYVVIVCRQKMASMLAAFFV